jgi:hypothetical protein
MADANLTFRMPEALKARLMDACERGHQTQSDFILAAITQRMDGACTACGRDGGALVTQPPGMTAAFDAWIRELVPATTSESGPVTIATQEPNGPRVYSGTFLGDGVFPSFLYLRPEEKGKPYLFDRVPIARAYVTMWAHYQAAELLRTRLRNGGYFDVTASLFNSAPLAPSADRSARTRKGRL